MVLKFVFAIFIVSLIIYYVDKYFRDEKKSNAEQEEINQEVTPEQTPKTEPSTQLTDLKPTKKTVKPSTGGSRRKTNHVRQSK